MFIILYSLSKSKKPLGSWVLKEEITKCGESISFATVGRLLKQLDNVGLTRLVQNKGRVLTEKGYYYLEKLRNDLEKKKIEGELKDSIHPKNIMDITELLKIRKIIEKEIIKLVVANATNDDIKQLERTIFLHHTSDESKDKEIPLIDFHALLSEISRNRILDSVLKLLIHEELMLEEKFPDIAKKLREAHHIEQHKQILEAVKKRDLDSAIKHTEEHIQHLIDSVYN